MMVSASPFKNSQKELKIIIVILLMEAAEEASLVSLFRLLTCLNQSLLRSPNSCGSSSSEG